VAEVDSSAIAVNSATSPCKLLAISISVPTAQDSSSARTGVPEPFVPASHRGNSPPRAMASGTSPCNNVQPLSAPRQLIVAKTAMNPAGPADQ